MDGMARPPRDLQVEHRLKKQEIGILALEMIECRAFRRVEEIVKQRGGEIAAEGSDDGVKDFRDARAVRFKPNGNDYHPVTGSAGE